MTRTPRERLTDIRDAARDLLEFVGTMESEAFHVLPGTDRMAHRAMKNGLVEIGEAIEALPPEVTRRHPDIDWRGFAGLRDVVSHGYSGWTRNASGRSCATRCRGFWPRSSRNWGTRRRRRDWWQNEAPPEIVSVPDGIWHRPGYRLRITYIGLSGLRGVKVSQGFHTRTAASVKSAPPGASVKSVPSYPIPSRLACAFGTAGGEGCSSSPSFSAPTRASG